MGKNFYIVSDTDKHNDKLCETLKKMEKKADAKRYKMFKSGKAQIIFSGIGPKGVMKQIDNPFDRHELMLKFGSLKVEISFVVAK